MNIVVSSNENYIKPLKIMLLSLFKYNKKCNIFLLYSDITCESLNELDNIIQMNGGIFNPILVNKDLFARFPNIGRISKEAYYRLLVTELLPEYIKKALYLDIDILVRNNLQELYNIDLDGNLMAAVIDQTCDNENEIHLKRIGLYRPYHYVNSGVLLFDIENMRKSININDIFKIITEKTDLIFADQDALNIYFKDNIKYINNTYNYIPFYGIEKKEKNPKIVHFIGDKKPWNKDYCFKFCFEYNEYMKRLKYKEDKNLCKFRIIYFLESLIEYLIKKVFI